jgi:5-methylcytosine-specific restriction endonuclease McrA
MLQARELSISTICLIASILDNDDKPSILERVGGKSRRDVEIIAREYRPPVELRDRMVPVQANTPDGIQSMVFVQFLAPDEFAGLFDEVRNLLPGDPSYGEASLAAFREYRDRHSPIARQKRREAKIGSASIHSHRWERNDATKSRHIPDEVRDVIFSRDGGQCTFVAADGTRCRCRKGLQFDHIRPYAAGGTHDPANLRLLCGAHNRLAAERALGTHVMRPFWRRQPKMATMPEA